MNGELMMKILPATFTELQSLVNHNMSLILEDRGYSPLVGKILSLLLFAAEPLSLQELSERLQVSKAAVSIQVRTMARNGMCDKVPYKNDRRDYYCISEELILTIIRTELAKVMKMQNWLNETLSALMAVTDACPNEQDAFEVFKHRCSQMSSLFGLFRKSLEGLQHEWAEQHA
jgi:DNA-binding transcriptional regulator GbsR (MarR family)